MLLALLLLVPLTALGLVLGMARLEETLLTAPAVPTEPSAATAPLAHARVDSVVGA